MKSAGLALAFIASLWTGGCAWTKGVPLVLLPPPARDGTTLVVLLSGDGDWSEFTGGLAEALNQRGFAVVGLRSRTYTLTGSTPDGAAQDLQQAVRLYLRRWHRSRLVLIGYSRGADLIPFVFNRWPADLQRRVDQAVFIGVHEWAGFRFHLLDLLFEVKRPGDLPVRPELAGMHGVPQICVVGTREHQSLCTRPLPCMQVISHEGGHLITRGAALITKLVALVEAGGESPRQRGCPAPVARRLT